MSVANAVVSLLMRGTERFGGGLSSILKAEYSLTNSTTPAISVAKTKETIHKSGIFQVSPNYLRQVLQQSDKLAEV